VYYVTDLGAAAASQSDTSVDRPPVDVDFDVRLGRSDSESRSVIVETGDSQPSITDQQTTDDAMQTAEDILDELDSD